MRDSPPFMHESLMHRFRYRYGQVLEWVVASLMIILALEVTVGVIFRTLGHSLVWYDETASIMLAWLTFYGSALASVRRAHIACPELVDRLPSAARRLIDIVAQVLVIAFFALFGWIGFSIMPVLAGESLVSLSFVSVNFVQSAIPVSAALIVLAELMHLIDLVNRTEPRPDSAALADSLQ